jgi:hypothetical protein
MLRTEADLIRTLGDGTYTLDELYARAATEVDIGRDGGLEAPDGDHPTDAVWKRRLRGALQTRRARGSAARIGKSVWAFTGTRARPTRLVLILAGTSLRDFELRLQDAATLLRTLEEPADLIACDPPYGLHRGTARSSAERVYRRRADHVVAGYIDVDPGRYEDFTFEWIEAAAGALRPGGNLVVVTGPQQAATVQYAAQASGLHFVASIAARREFPLFTSRRPSCAHWTITAMCRGRPESPKRVFNVADDLPKARSGKDYPLDWWAENGRSDRPGLLRYDNGLPDLLGLRIITTFSDPTELVVDPAVGGGGLARPCLQLGRRFIGGDLNPNALRFTAGRILDEDLWPQERAPVSTIGPQLQHALFTATTVAQVAAPVSLDARRDRSELSLFDLPRAA